MPPLRISITIYFDRRQLHNLFKVAAASCTISTGKIKVGLTLRCVIHTSFFLILVSYKVELRPSHWQVRCKENPFQVVCYAEVMTIFILYKIFALVLIFCTSIIDLSVTRFSRQQSYIEVGTM